MYISFTLSELIRMTRLMRASLATTYVVPSNIGFFYDHLRSVFLNLTNLLMFDNIVRCRHMKLMLQIRFPLSIYSLLPLLSISFRLNIGFCLRNSYEPVLFPIHPILELRICLNIMSWFYVNACLVSNVLLFSTIFFKIY